MDFDYIFASTTDIVQDALSALVTNYVLVIGGIILLSFGFYFLWKIVRKGKKAVH